MKSIVANIIFALLVVGFISSCGSDGSATIDGTDEAGQQVGDAMASLDEMGGSNGSIAFLEMREDRLEKYFGKEKASFLEMIVPSTYAASCSAASTFGACTGTSLVRTFSDCTVGGATFNGTVTFSYGGGAAACSIPATGNSVARDPSFTITGRYGGTYTVSKTGTVGQKITRTGVAAFAFTNDGIRRIFRNSASTIVADFTTVIADVDGITVTGATRANRVVNGGTLKVTNNLTGLICSLSPSNVAHQTGCNCGVSGSWTGSCSDGTTMTTTLTGCGTATVTLGTVTKTVTLDRCYQL